MIRDAMADGAQRRRGIRALGRLEQPEQIRWVAPALADGVGIRAEAADALAQMARTPEAVAEVQRLLIERAGVDAGAGHVGIVGRDRGRARPPAVRHRGRRSAQAEARAGAGVARARFVQRRGIGGAGRRGRAAWSRSRAPRARKLGHAATPHVGPAAMGGHRAAPAADPRSALDPPARDGGAHHRQRGHPSVIDRALLDRDAEVRRLAARPRARTRASRTATRLLQRAPSPITTRTCAGKACAPGAASCRRPSARRCAPR